MSTYRPPKRRNGESDADYIVRLERQNRSLKENNNSIADWCSRISEAVTTLCVEGSVAIQVLAEKAEVRSHPSVAAAVQLFDALSHPQWHRPETKEVPRNIQWPTDWNLDPPDAWAGDADMSADNSPIMEAIEFLESLRFTLSGKRSEDLFKIIDLLHKASLAPLEGIKDRSGFTSRQVAAPSADHFKDMSSDELRELLSAMGWLALDLAQDMHFANFMLRRDLRAAAYRRICGDLYQLARFHFDHDDSPINIKVLGGEVRPS